MSRTTKLDALNKKIENAEQAVSRARKQYEHATDELKMLLDKRDAIRKNELINAIAKSNKSYDEIMAFITSTAAITD